jgi:hypothetical protein
MLGVLLLVGEQLIGERLVLFTGSLRASAFRRSAAPPPLPSVTRTSISGDAPTSVLSRGSQQEHVGRRVDRAESAIERQGAPCSGKRSRPPLRDERSGTLRRRRSLPSLSGNCREKVLANGRRPRARPRPPGRTEPGPLSRRTSRPHKLVELLRASSSSSSSLEAASAAEDVRHDEEPLAQVVERDHLVEKEQLRVEIPLRAVAVGQFLGPARGAVAEPADGAAEERRKSSATPPCVSLEALPRRRAEASAPRAGARRRPRIPAPDLQPAARTDSDERVAPEALAPLDRLEQETPRRPDPATAANAATGVIVSAASVRNRGMTSYSPRSRSKSFAQSIMTAPSARRFPDSPPELRARRRENAISFSAISTVR